MPALEYGGGLWGVNCVHASWKLVEQFWYSIARTTLSAPSKTPLAALQGELGWAPFRARVCSQVVAYWERISRMNDDHIVKQALNVQRELLHKGEPCWLANFKVMLYSMGATCKSIFDNWFDHDTLDITRSRIQQEHDSNRAHSPREETVRVVDIIKEQVIKHVNNEWLFELARTEAKSGHGGNKLRTYARFKADCVMEPYLLHVNDWRKRALLMRFRSGVAPLRIETGRYEASGSGTRGIPVQSRICLCCGLGVEDEQHMFVDCPLYYEERQVLINTCMLYNQGERNLELRIRTTERDRFFIGALQCTNFNVCNAVANFIWNAFELCSQHLSTL
jgi:hypothetical protein